MELNESEITKKIIRLRNLTCYKNSTDAELRDLAIAKLTAEPVKKEEDRIDAEFANKKESKLAKDLHFKYLEDYSIETISDRNTLREIIYLEVIQRRLQEKLNEYYEKNEKALPLQLIETIHKNQAAILELKDSLGLNRAKNQKTTYDVLEHLKKRFKKWREENSGSRTAVCPHCSKMILFKIRTDKWELGKHPFFKDKILANTHLVKLFKENKLNREDIAKILDCSPDYIDWLIDKWFKNTPQV